MLKKTYRLNSKVPLTAVSSNKDYELIVTWSLFGIPIYVKIADETLFAGGYNSYF